MKKRSEKAAYAQHTVTRLKSYICGHVLVELPASTHCAVNKRPIALATHMPDWTAHIETQERAREATNTTLKRFYWISAECDTLVRMRRFRCSVLVASHKWNSKNSTHHLFRLSAVFVSFVLGRERPETKNTNFIATYHEKTFNSVNDGVNVPNKNLVSIDKFNI